MFIVFWLVGLVVILPSLYFLSRWLHALDMVPRSTLFLVPFHRLPVREPDPETDKHRRRALAGTAARVLYGWAVVALAGAGALD